MTSACKIADSIKRGLQEAVAYAEGTTNKSGYGVHVPATVDIQVIRAKPGLLDPEFGRTTRRIPA